MKPANEPANMNQPQPSDTVGLCPHPGPTTGTTTAADVSPAVNTLPIPTPIPTPESAPSDPLAIIQRDRVESLKRKQRTDSFLHRLDEAQLTKVLQWLAEEEDIGVVHHHITAP